MSYRKKNDAKKTYKPDGELRQSQMVTTFGPGAMVDLVDRAVVIGGLEHWGFGARTDVFLDDARLRRSLIPKLKKLDPDLDLAKEGYFRKAPEGDAKDAQPSVGVRALEFPRWLVCQKCRRLARAADGFENKNGRYFHTCAKNQVSLAVPVRFVAACERGHLSDFPWALFAHQEREGGLCDRQELYLEEPSLGDISRIVVRCKNCEASNPLNQASNVPYRCAGERPWLGGRGANEICQEKSELLVRTASNAYFAQVVSALKLPGPSPDPLRQRLREPELWKLVKNIKTVEELVMVKRLMEPVAGALGEHANEAVLKAIAAENAEGGPEEEPPLRSFEYGHLVRAPVEQPGVHPQRGAIWAAYRVPKQRVDLPKGIGGLVVVPVLREVRVQVSFSRLVSISPNFQGEYDEKGRGAKPAVLTMPTGNEKWLPAADVRGEGIFIELDRDVLDNWEKSDAVRARTDQLWRAFEAQGGGDFPGIRFFLLHSMAHLLLTAISLECGYSASAIRERLYCGQAEANGPDMAAILLATGTTGSEGTLGGLVEEGRRLRHHLGEAWDLGRLCSNDPICATHDPAAPSSDRRSEGAACHGCLYIAESSCERFNRYLDRALVVPAIGNDPRLAFFQERP